MGAVLEALALAQEPLDLEEFALALTAKGSEEPQFPLRFGPVVPFRSLL